MFLILFFFIAILAIAYGLSLLKEIGGGVTVDLPGYAPLTLSIFEVVVGMLLLSALIILTWMILSGIIRMPSSLSDFFKRRRQRRGLEALSSGMVAVSAGDRGEAGKFATQARKALPNEPLTDLLRAQAAQLHGDRATARRIFDGMTSTPQTEVLGLRGLFLEAQREGETTAARQFAQRAVRLNPKLGWATDALFDIQCSESDWPGALETLAISKKNGNVERGEADRKRAVLLTAQAVKAEQDNQNDVALKLASEAAKLAPNLVPAAEVAGRILASQGGTGKASKILSTAWKSMPHPDLALVYAHARPGDSPADRLVRVKQLASMAPHSVEAPIALANAAIEAKEWNVARMALAPLAKETPTSRVCTLMARVEQGETGNKGAVREWLARAVNAKQDPAWTADGIVSDQWAPVSPVTGELDAFEWKAPVEDYSRGRNEVLLEQLRMLELAHDTPEETSPVVVVDEGASDAPAAPAVVEDVVEAASEAVSNGVDRAGAAAKAATAAAATATTAVVAKAKDAVEDVVETVEEAISPENALVPVESEEDKKAQEEEAKKIAAEVEAKRAANREKQKAKDYQPEPTEFVQHRRAPDDPGVTSDTGAAPSDTLKRYREPPSKAGT